jgi:lysozyme
MKARHQVSRAAIDLIKRFEGYRRQSARLPDDRWTIGYGHTLTARQGAEVSEKDAEALLIYDLIAVAHAVNEWTFVPLTQNQFDALCAFAFNIGLENFRHSSVLRRINEGDLLQAALAMELWRRADFEGEQIVVDALVRRRAAEKALFLTPPDGFVPAPSPVLRPNLDYDTTGLVPREAPAMLRTSLDGPLAVATRQAPADKPPEPAEPPSAAQTAAAAVSARLAAIFPEEPAETAAEPPATPPAPQQQWSLSARAQATRRSYGPSPASVSPAASAEEPMAVSAFAAPSELADAPFAAPAGRSHRGARRNGEALRGVVRGLLGLALFGGGLWMALASRNAGASREAVAMGWLACLAGVLLFAFAAYALLKRLARNDAGA